jgi:hypothetical protein
MHYVLKVHTLVLQGYVDSNMEGDKYSRKSTTRYVFTIGGTIVNWISKLKKVVALSKIEAEYVVATKASKEMIWLQRFMEELGKKKEKNKLYYDSESAIHLANNSAFHSNTKHIHMRYHFIRFSLEDGQLKMKKIHTSQNPIDMLTKGVTREKLSSYLSFSWSSRMKMKMRNFPGPRRFIVQHIQQRWSC